MPRAGARVHVCVIDRIDGAGGEGRTLRDLMRTYDVQRVLPSNLEDVRPDTQALFVRAAYFGDLEELIERLPALAWIHVAIAGTEHLPKELMARKGIVLTNSAGVLDRAIGEFVAACVLMWSKGLIRSARDTPFEAVHHREPLSNDQLRVVVIGAGGIGTATAQSLRSLGVERIVGVRRGLHGASRDFDDMFPPEELSEKVGDFNVVVGSLPGSPQTAKLISRDVLTNMSHPAVFVNVGRGSTVDHDSLAATLRNRPESAAVLDVTDPEPLPPGDPLWSLPNVVISPHMAGDTVTRHERYAELFRRNLDRFARDQELLNIVRSST